MLLADGTCHAHLARMHPVTRQMSFLVLPSGVWEGDERDAIRYAIADASLDARVDPEAVLMGW
jgi:hypothetical protein